MSEGVIYLVDDDDTMLLSVERMIAKNFPEYEIASYHNGAEAFYHLRTMPPPVLHIVDYNMPYMNGLDYAIGVRDVNQWTQPIILYSGMPNIQETLGTARHYFSRIISKDLHDGLLVAVENCLLEDKND